MTTGSRAKAAQGFLQSRDGTPPARHRAAVGHDAYVHVTGLDEIHEDLASRGATILAGPVTRVHGMREIVVEDRHGLRIAIGEVPGRAG